MNEIMETLGYRVRPVDRPIFAEARGFWPMKWIAVGKLWLLITPEEQTALLYHEAYHCREFHAEKRLLAIALFWTRFVQRWAYRQELAADLFAVASGHAAGLLRVLHRVRPFEPEGQHDFHPRASDRIRAILKETRK